MKTFKLDEIDGFLCPVRNRCEQVSYDCERGSDYKYCCEYQRIMRREKMKYILKYRKV